MDTVDLARLQFATTAGLHWLFVILTLGLAPLIAVMHTRSVVGRDAARSAELERMTRFWGQLYVVNYAMGIASGLVIEFQFGLSWSGLSKVAGNVFGAPVALETLVAFFAESTFLGMWLFGWGRIRRGVHVTLIWLVTLTGYASVYFIMVANGFMQNPVGYRLSEGRVFLTDFGAVLTNPSTLDAVFHIASAALVTGGLFVAGVSAAHLLRDTPDRPFFTRSLRIGTVTAAVASFPAYLIGALQYAVLGETQPMKLAALGPRPAIEAFSAQLATRYGPGDYAPPEWAASAMYTMLYLGYVVFVVAMVSLLVVFRDTLRRRLPIGIPVVAAVAYAVSQFVGGLVHDGTPGPDAVLLFGITLVVLGAFVAVPRLPSGFRALGWVLPASIPLPFLASLGGWLFREGGRQPWMVYGLLTVDDALTTVGRTTVLASTIGFTVALLALLVTDWVLIVRFGRRGPDGSQLAPSSPQVPERELATF